MQLEAQESEKLKHRLVIATTNSKRRSVRGTFQFETSRRDKPRPEDKLTEKQLKDSDPESFLSGKVARRSIKKGATWYSIELDEILGETHQSTTQDCSQLKSLEGELIRVEGKKLSELLDMLEKHSTLFPKGASRKFTPYKRSQPQL